MIRFEWDPVKAERNERNHDITFDDAMYVFADPNALFEQDRVDESGEQRWHAIGLAAGVAVVLVVHAVREDALGEVIRLVSARRATRKERIRYEKSGE